MKLTKKQIFILILNILFPLVVGFVSGRLAPNTNQVYSSIKLPYFAPKAQVFPIVWGIIYLLAGISSFIVIMSAQSYRKNENYYANFEDYKIDKEKKCALGFYIALILVSGLWIPIFFTLGKWKISFVIITIIVILAAITASKFFKINKTAGVLLAPFALWSAFASILLYNIIILN